MEFFLTLKNSVYNPRLYEEIVQQPFSKSFLFFFKYTLLLTGVFSITLILFVSLFLFRGKIDQLGDNFIEWYPGELIVTIQNGIISTNQIEPYTIPLPTWFREDTESSTSLKNLFVIDTASSPTIERAEEYKTLVLVGENALGFVTDTATFEIIPITKDTNLVIDQSLIENITQKGINFAKKTGFLLLLIFIPLLLFSVFFSTTLLYLAFGALVVLLIARSKKLSYTYVQSYSIALYLICLPQALSILNGKIGVYIPFLRTILLAILAYVNLEEKKLATASFDQENIEEPSLSEHQDPVAPIEALPRDQKE